VVSGALLLPGGVIPASLAYGPLVEALGDRLDLWVDLRPLRGPLVADRVMPQQAAPFQAFGQSTSSLSILRMKA
jgi:hypothetical protein